MFRRHEMLSEIRAAAVKKHGTPTIRGWNELKNEGAPSTSTIVGFFGSWNNAMNQAGLNPNGNNHRWRQLRW